MSGSLRLFQSHVRCSQQQNQRSSEEKKNKLICVCFFLSFFFLFFLFRRSQKETPRAARGRQMTGGENALSPTWLWTAKVKAWRAEGEVNFTGS